MEEKKTSKSLSLVGSVWQFSCPRLISGDPGNPIFRGKSLTNSLPDFLLKFGRSNAFALQFSIVGFSMGVSPTLIYCGLEVLPSFHRVFFLISSECAHFGAQFDVFGRGAAAAAVADAQRRVVVAVADCDARPSALGRREAQKVRRRARRHGTHLRQGRSFQPKSNPTPLLSSYFLLTPLLSYLLSYFFPTPLLSFFLPTLLLTPLLSYFLLTPLLSYFLLTH